MPILKMSEVPLTHKRVLIRVDLNVPIENGKIMSAKRIEAIVPTLQMALKQGAQLILMSHLGRPKAEAFDPALSLAPVADYLSQRLQYKVRLASLEEAIPEKGEMVLLENVRFLPGEKENSPILGKKLAALCDVFVMEAFATAHRKEASTYAVAEYADQVCAGPLVISEIEALEKILKNPVHPMVAIVGGSKVSTKLSVLKKILSLVDDLIVGGGIANTFLAAKGFSVGKSLYEPDLIPEAKEMLSFAKTHHKRIILPEDVVVAKDFSEQASAQTIPIAKINEDDMILDVGPKTSEIIHGVIKEAKTILWNGPLGVFEWDRFSQGTANLAQHIADSPAFCIAGGGDTLAAIEKYQIEAKIAYISTGGGAFLEFLEGNGLPAINILNRPVFAHETH